MAHTRTHQFPIGFRQGGSEWQRDLGSLIAFAAAEGFRHVDTRPLAAADLKRICDSGLGLGTVDLPDWRGLLAGDGAERRDAVSACADYVREATAAGASRFFLVLLPPDPALPRAESFGFAVDALGCLCDAIGSMGAKLAIEGWPGPGPHWPSLGCTPADLRALFERVPHSALGINFDPSHLIRMGIDPVRFAAEFAERIVHVHGKDTEILTEGLYEHGNLQRATFAQTRRFGGHSWRYTIPGHGSARWGVLFETLKAAGYTGGVSIELEDEDFNGSQPGEKAGLIAAGNFLASV